MIFTSVRFIEFLAGVLVGLQVIPARFRKLFLLAASYFFYAAWDARFLVLILLSTLIDYVIGRALALTDDAGRRFRLLLVSLVANLGFLGFFKYANFFIDSASVFLGPLGFSSVALQIILPVGISFYTFQTLSYTIDVYRGSLEPTSDIVEFALFVAFFPQLVAGPIVRAADFLPQLRDPVRVAGQNLWVGGQIFLVGMAKKLLIADRVAPFVDRFYESPALYSWGTAWLAVLAYSLQIYGDFSGYSDMAIGTARMMGFRLPENFNMPYSAVDIREFWRRWHISLSTWLRDYLYIPLGGSRASTSRVYTNLMVTMGLGGLWHGASWNFVVWGLSHGFALALHRALPKRGRRTIWSALAGWFGTFLFVSLAWVLFRAPDWNTAILVLRRLADFNAPGFVWMYVWAWIGLAVVTVTHLYGRWRPADDLVLFDSPYSFKAAVGITILALLIYLGAPTGISPFLYFQF